MIRKTATGVLRFWPEAIAGVAPFALLLPLAAITARLLPQVWL